MKSIGAISSLFTLPSKEVWNIENGLNWAYNQTLRTDMPCGLCNALELADDYRMNYSSKAHSRNMDIYFSGNSYFKPYDYEEKIRSDVPVQLRCRIRFQHAPRPQQSVD